MKEINNDKAIVIIDRPTKCSKCLFVQEWFNEYGETIYYCTFHRMNVFKNGEICEAIRPLPQKKEIIRWDKKKYPKYVDWCEHLRDLSSDEKEESTRNEGYNLCINVILGE